MKSRNREINIFNMSLLDILCGALGAFCFMMLSLLPYYRPPGEDYKKITEEQQKILEEVQDIKDLAERLKNTTNVEDLRELVEKLKEQILVLENQIKKLQGQLNALYAENTELKEQIEKLKQEKEQLLTQLDEARMKQQQLEQEKQQLQEQKRKLEDMLDSKTTWMVAMNPQIPAQLVYCCLVEMKLSSNDGKRKQPEFDPSKRSYAPFWPGDYTVRLGAHSVWIDQNRIPGGVQRLYVSYSLDKSNWTPTTVFADVHGYGIPYIKIPSVTLTPERYWTWVGTFTFDDKRQLQFAEATEAEREAEWKRLTKEEMPPPPKPPPSPGPSAPSQEELSVRRNKAMFLATVNDRVKDLPADTADRLKAFARKMVDLKLGSEREETMVSAVGNAKSNEETALIMSIYNDTQRFASTPSFTPSPGPGGRTPRPAPPSAGPAAPFGTTPSPK